MKNLNKIKSVLKEFTYPKYSGMSLNELSRMIYISAQDDETEEDYEEDSNVAKNDALEEANKSLIN